MDKPAGFPFRSKVIEMRHVLQGNLQRNERAAIATMEASSTPRAFLTEIGRLAKRIWKIGDLPADHPYMKWRDWPYWWT